MFSSSTSTRIIWTQLAACKILVANCTAPHTRPYCMCHEGRVDVVDFLLLLVSCVFVELCYKNTRSPSCLTRKTFTLQFFFFRGLSFCPCFSSSSTSFFVRSTRRTTQQSCFEFEAIDNNNSNIICGLALHAPEGYDVVAG